MTNKTTTVYLVDGSRTPLLKATGLPGPFSAADLAVAAGQPLLLRQHVVRDAIGEVILGCAMPSIDEANIARIVAIRLGLPEDIPAWTVMRNCASGLQAIDAAMQDIITGRYQVVLAGGTEAMSRAPLIFSDQLTQWLLTLNKQKTTLAKLKTAVRLPVQHLMPKFALLHGLSDPLIGTGMGETAEELAYRFNITRRAMDEFARTSHLRLANAIDNNYIPELITIYDSNGQVYNVDTGLRRDISIEKLAQLPPAFDKKYGLVTAGNSSQITDGAALVLLASEQAVEHYQLPVLAKLHAVEWAALDPAVMGLGPAFAAGHLLQRLNIPMDQIDYWEINEAFAAQVLACNAAWQDAEFCQKALNSSTAFSGIATDRLNVDGGAIAVGHPIGATGARITLHLAHVLKRHHARLGIATLCIGGGQGGAILLENV